MNAFKLFAASSKDQGWLLLRTLGIEWLHTSLAVAPNGLVVWLVWQLVIEQRIDSSFWYLLGLMLILFLLQLFIAPAVVRRTNSIAYSLSCRLRNLLANHATQLSLGAFGEQRLGHFADQLSQSINRFEFVLSHSINNLLAALSVPSILLLVLVYLDWRLSLCILISVVLSLVVHHVVGGWLRHHEYRARSSERELRTQLSDYLQMLPVIKSYSSKAWWQNKYAKLAHRAADNKVMLEIAANPLAQITSLLLDLGFVLTLWLALVLHPGNMTAPVNLLVFALVGYRVFEPIKVLYADWILIRQVDDELAIAARLLDFQPLPICGSGAAPSKNFSIHCQNLVFTYPQSEAPVLNGVNAIFAEATTTALVGLSGSGKTTLLQLLMRFWDPQQGAILIGGVPLTSMAPDDIAALYSPVFQQPYLFDETLINNVRFGKPNATAKELTHALEASGCTRLASSLPHGLETRIGEGGRLLSSGQQQLIAIARCFLKDAPIVLFDEATATLDPENSHLIYQAIEQLCKQKTTLVIAHSLARIKHADTILVLNDGVISETGKHATLLAQGGIYARLWSRQQTASGWQIQRKQVLEK